MKKSLYLLLIGTLLSIAIRVYFILHGSEVADIHSLQEMGELYLRGINPYLALNYNVYPPLAIYLEALTLHLSALINVPFYILIKLWPNLADILTGFLIYLFLTKKGVKPNIASLWGLIFLLNPISLIISSAHGQIDSIPSFLVILSIFSLTFNLTRFSYVISALFLGLSIAIKPNPLILLPFFLIFRKTDFKTKLIFLFFTTVPLVLLFIPFLQDNAEYVLKRIFDYSGASDFGLPAIWRGIYYLQTGSYKFEFTKEILQYSKIFFLIGLIFLAFIYRNSNKLINSLLAIYLLFLSFYFGVSAQYLSWVLPLAVLKQDLMVIPFSLSGIVSLISFYLFLNPRIIVTELSTIPPFQSQFMLIYAFSNLIFWAITLFWLIKVILPNFPKRKL